MSGKKKIKDSPKFKKLKKQADTALTLFENPFLANIFDFSPELYDKVKELASKTEKLLNLPDSFNTHFASLGWIAHDNLNTELTQKAVQLADQGKFDDAEQLLTDHFNFDTIKFGLMRMNGHKSFWPRREFANTVRDDYLAERYQSCIPMLFILIDGIVCDVSNKSFSATGVELEAWDCIAAHSSGLKQVVKVITKTRRPLNEEMITIPFRNGIIHGRDINYANKINAAKLWNLLFAICDWAKAVRDGRKGEEPQTDPEPSLYESLDKLAKETEKLEETKQRLSEWTPRSIEQLNIIPNSGKPDQYDPDTPERALSKLFDHWAAKNYGGIANLLWWGYSEESTGKVAGRVRGNIGVIEYTGFEIIKISDTAPAISTIKVKISINHCSLNIIVADFRIIRMDAENNPIERGNPEGRWRIQEATLAEIHRDFLMACRDK